MGPLRNSHGIDDKSGIHTGCFARGRNYVESQKTVYLHNMVMTVRL